MKTTIWLENLRSLWIWVRSCLIFVAIILFLMLCSDHESVFTHWGTIIKKIKEPFALVEWDAKFWSGVVTSAVIAIPVACIWERIKTFFKKQRPSCRLWRLKKPENCVIIISCTPRSAERTPKEVDERSDNLPKSAPINPTDNTVPWTSWENEPPASVVMTRPLCKDELAEKLMKMSSSLEKGFLPNLKHLFHGVPLRTLYFETRMDTGEGQLRSLPFLIASLHDAYGTAINWSNLCMAGSPRADLLAVGRDKDVILVGGSQTNKFTACCLASLQKETGVCIKRMNGGGLEIEAPPSEEHPKGVNASYTVRRFFKEPEDESSNRGRAYVIEEYSVIIRWQQTSEQLNHNRYFIFAGCTTHGTAIASQFFCEQVGDDPMLRKRKGDYLAVLKTSIAPHNGDEHGNPSVELVIPLNSTAP